MAALAFGLTGLRAGVYAGHALNPTLEGRDVLVTGVVVGLPQRNEAGLRFRLQVEAASINGQPTDIPARMDVGWYGGAFSAGPSVLVDSDTAAMGERTAPPLVLNRLPAVVRAGERWTMPIRVKAPHGSRNPHGFDYELWLWEQGVQATGYVRASPTDPAALMLGQTWRHPVALARQVVRDRIMERLESRQLAGVIAALVVGDQNAIDRADWDVFRATGVAHLVSISGLHITMFAWGAALLLGWAWRRSSRLCLTVAAPHAALVGGLALACAYALFSGWGIPAQRTCLMLAVVCLLRLAGARWPWHQVWMLACASVVVVDPWALLQPGFWLSFVAVGILFATDSGAPYASQAGVKGQNDVEVLEAVVPVESPRWRTALQRVAIGVVSGLREQWVITLALAPLSLLLFGQLSLVGLFANAIAIPWVTLVITPLALLGVVFAGLWDVAAVALNVLLVALQWLAGWPWAAVSMAIPPVWIGTVGMLGALVVVLPLPWTVRLLGLPLLLPLALWRVPLPPQGHFELLAADIGQGNAVLVRTATHALLYDAGPRYSLESDAGHRVLVPLLRSLGTQLDRVVLSHRDTDHVGGANSVLAMQPQADLWSSMEPDTLLQPVRPVQRCQAGQHWVWDGVRFDVLHPQGGAYDAPAKPNALSCVLRISSGDRAVLLAGDIEEAQEAQLVADGVNLRADVLLVPHHGSKTSSSAAFLQAVQPTLALVQAGYRNRFGHPATVVVERYRRENILLIDSPHCGAFVWQSWRLEAPQNDACLRLREQRYWHHRVP
jgi:competence protein ComEC